MVTERQRAGSIAWLAALLLATGCANPSVLMERRLPAGGDAFARQYVHLLLAGDTARALAEVDPAMRSPANLAGLASIAAGLAGNEPDTLVPVRSLRTYVGGRWYYTVDYQSRLADNWILFSVILTRPAAGWAVSSVQARWLPASVQETNAFRLKGQSFAHYAVLALGLASLLFSLYTLVLVLRTPGVRRWAWAIACLIAVGNLQLDWTTGAAHFVGFSVVLLGLAVSRADLAGPWVVQVGFPLGAALFHWRGLIHPVWRRPEQAETQPSVHEGEQPPHE